MRSWHVLWSSQIKRMWSQASCSMGNLGSVVEFYLTAVRAHLQFICHFLQLLPPKEMGRYRYKMTNNVWMCLYVLNECICFSWQALCSLYKCSGRYELQSLVIWGHEHSFIKCNVFLTSLFYPLFVDLYHLSVLHRVAKKAKLVEKVCCIGTRRERMCCRLLSSSFSWISVPSGAFPW